jgi:hypothetical protein
MMQFLVGAVVFCPLVSALAFVAPRATPAADAIELHLQGWSPRPTNPFNKELLKRQIASSLTQIEGPDSVCGYQFGVQSKFGLPSSHLWLLTIILRWRIGTVLHIKLWICYRTGPIRGDLLLWFYHIRAKTAVDIVPGWHPRYKLSCRFCMQQQSGHWTLVYLPLLKHGVNFAHKD